MRILLATTSGHKLDEVRAIFKSLMTPDAPKIELISLENLGRNIPAPDENEKTFEGNAVLKARYYSKATGYATLADDSGLEVDVINHEPGVRSARYASATGPSRVIDLANNKLLLEKLSDIPADHRKARFICCMALCAVPGASDAGLLGRFLGKGAKPGKDDEKGRIVAKVRGSIEGRIIGPDNVTPQGRGQYGFGYDPLFLIPSQNKTLAEIPPQDKNVISHRGQAARLMWEEIKKVSPKLLGAR
ncbi:MAG: non-canonical purine NTP pyrophosphatase [Planctomycetes bacterium]|nr:non-canonical purine NTP pyrophosphatase [Planctomycetota bacterium]